MNNSNADWTGRRNQQLDELATVINLAGEILPQGERTIEISRLHGAALLAHSIELARGIRRCMNDGLPGAAAALARAQYEAALRGHTILNEIEIDELNSILARTAVWMEIRDKGGSRKGPPKIDIDRHRWRCVIGAIGDTQHYISDWQNFRSEIAKLYVASAADIPILHDLTHSGFTQSVQMLNPESEIGPNYSEQNQALLLHFAVRTVMFAIMTWPGIERKYTARIERKAEALRDAVALWSCS